MFLTTNLSKGNNTIPPTFRFNHLNSTFFWGGGYGVYMPWIRNFYLLSTKVTKLLGCTRLVLVVSPRLLFFWGGPVPGAIFEYIWHMTFPTLPRYLDVFGWFRRGARGASKTSSPVGSPRPSGKGSPQNNSSTGRHFPGKTKKIKVWRFKWENIPRKNPYSVSDDL